jgi:uncharacterized membrane protein
MAFGYEMVLGKPLMLWVGITGLVLLILAAACGYRTMKGKGNLKRHKMLAAAAVLVGILHAIMAMSFYM